MGDICSKISSGNTPAGGSKGGAYVLEGFLREQNIYNDGIRNDGVQMYASSVQVVFKCVQVVCK